MILLVIFGVLALIFAAWFVMEAWKEIVALHKSRDLYFWSMWPVAVILGGLIGRLAGI